MSLALKKPLIMSSRGYEIKVFADYFIVTAPDGRWERVSSMAAVRRWIRYDRRR